MLNKDRIRYGHFDVLKDPVSMTTFQLVTDFQEVRKTLKDFSKCNSYPQMFVQGLFIGGGLSLMRELSEKGQLTDLIPQTELFMIGNEKIEKLLRKGRCMIFMKGTPTIPEGPESQRLMAMLTKYPELLKDLEHFDLTKDPEILRTLYQYSNYWEVPQLYVDQKLVGGLEILEALDHSGELGAIILTPESHNPDLSQGTD